MTQPNIGSRLTGEDLFRGVVEEGYDGGEFRTAAFRRSSSDGTKLSMDRAIKCSAKDCFNRRIAAGSRTVAVLVVGTDEVFDATDLPAYESPLALNPAHAHLEFPDPITPSEDRATRRKLARIASDRGRAYP